MRRNRNSWSLSRAWFSIALVLVAIVNILYIWPARPSVSSSTSTGTTARVQGRKQLASVKPSPDPQPGALTVHLHCADLAPDCEQQRHAGKCSNHLLEDFHTCLASCGVCPALALAVRDALNLTTPELGQQLGQAQLVLVQRPGPPQCVDDIGACGVALNAAEQATGAAGARATDAAVGRTDCSASPLPLVGACKATCGACTGGSTATATSGSGPAQAADGGGCFDSMDMCAWWAAHQPRICERAAREVQRWWWVAVACRRTCGLCIGAEHGEASAGGGDAAVATLAAAFLHGVQVGEGADGMPRVAVYELVPDPEAACSDREAQCGSWAAAGECGRNPGFMATACAASCRTCPVLLHLPNPLARVRLNNGVLMPTVGYGCAGLSDLTAQTVRWALDAGFRMLDSAQAREWYREDLVGAALADFLAAQPQSGAAEEVQEATHGSGLGPTDATASAVPSSVVRREDIFITTKLHPRHLGYKTTLRQFNASLADLRTPYVDLFLLHYAECWGDLCGGVRPDGTFLDSWRALEELYEAGLARAIGVSNFSPAQLTQLLAAARVRPAVLQAHVDPLERAEALQAQCRAAGVTLTAYSTLGTQWGLGSGRNPVLGHPVLQALGRQAGARSAAAVALRWALQQGLVVLPRSANQARIRQNLQLYDWGLSAEQVAQVAHLRPAL